MTVPVALIAAVGRNGVIGSMNRIPWRLPSDFAYFKRTTLGKPVIMGRKTYESIGRPLPGRINIVVTGRKDFAADGVVVVDSLGAGLAHAQAAAESSGANEVVVAGGGDIYRQAIAVADRLYITHVDASPEGDVTFPSIDPAVWTLAGEPQATADPRDTAGYTIRIYERRNPGKR